MTTKPSAILDKNGVVIEEFDVLKVFHFIRALLSAEKGGEG